MSNTANITCDLNKFSVDQETFLKEYIWWMDMGGNLPVGLIGFVLNSVAIFVLSTATMRNNFFNRLLICLAIFDNLYISCEIYEVCRRREYTLTQQHIFVNFVYPVRSVFMCCSIYSTVALTLERFYAITSPAEYRMRGTSNLGKRLLYYMLPVLGFSIIYYIPKYLDLNVDEVTQCTIGNKTTIINNASLLNYTDINKENCITTYPLIATTLRINHHYVVWYINISNLVVTCIIPLSILIYLNCRIYSSLNQFIQRQPSTCTNHPANSARRQQHSDVKKTFILFSIVVVFTVCHSLRITLNFDELLNLSHFKKDWEKGCDGVKFWPRIVVPINQLLIIINSSANFFVYVFFDHGFQQVLRHAYIIRSEVHSHTRNNVDTNTAVTRITNSNAIELTNMNVHEV